MAVSTPRKLGAPTPKTPLVVVTGEKKTGHPLSKIKAISTAQEFQKAESTKAQLAPLAKKSLFDSDEESSGDDLFGSSRSGH